MVGCGELIKFEGIRERKIKECSMFFVYIYEIVVLNVCLVYISGSII